MNKVIIIGGGQLGSRHLQGLLKCKFPLEISVVDPSQESLDRSRACELEVKERAEGTIVNYFNDQPKNGSYDLAIIATSANIRESVSRRFILNNHVTNIIFEKVLFQSLEDYESVFSLLEKNKIKGYVNCPRRLYPAYQSIRDILVDESKVDMTVTGSKWGLACNGIHFIDAFAFVSCEPEIKLDATKLSKNVIESKRKGYYEVMGTLEGLSPKGSIALTCDNKDSVGCLVTITTPNYRIVVNEREGYYQVESNGEVVREKFSPYFQSQLTGTYIEKIIQSQELGITDYNESSKIHKEFISSMLTHFREYHDSSINECPIT